jgi:soluble lytic murein transglycosylase-like protein
MLSQAPAGFAPARETVRRLAALGLVAGVAAAWAVALGAKTVPFVAPASAARQPVVPDRTPACPFPAGLRSAFESAARDTSVPPALLYAVAKVESNLEVDARSPVGARGLLQLMPATAESLALDPDQPETNVLAGARYLRQMLDRFGSVDLALAAYNAGPTAVTKAGGAPSTGVVRYVDNVDAAWRSVAGCR